MRNFSKNIDKTKTYILASSRSCTRVRVRFRLFAGRLRRWQVIVNEGMGGLRVPPGQAPSSTLKRPISSCTGVGGVTIQRFRDYLPNAGAVNA
jgi:hypothetical protein